MYILFENEMKIHKFTQTRLFRIHFAWWYVLDWGCDSFRGVILCLVVVLCICASVRGVVIISVIDFSSFQGVIGRLPCIMTLQVLNPSEYDAIQSANMLDLVLYIWI